MTQTTVKQYKEAIQQILLPRQITGLQVLYSFPNASATAKQLAQKIHPSNPAPIIASGMIGRIGKRIAEYCKIDPGTYYDGKERTAYFRLVSDGYTNDKGWTMYPNLQRALEQLNLVNKRSREILERLPNEVMPYEEQELFREGKVTQVFVNKYERSQTARIKCIEHYGYKCYVCHFDFGKTYGKIAEGFIHVHHKVPLAEFNEEYKVNPIKDLVPLCANCHSVVHLSKPVLTVQKLKKLIKL